MLRRISRFARESRRAPGASLRRRPCRPGQRPAPGHGDLSPRHGPATQGPRTHTRRQAMKRSETPAARLRAACRRALPALALLGAAAGAQANTLTQNVSWTIDRAGTATTYRVVAYGDAIYAGYNTSVFNAAKYAAPTVDAEYLSALWNADIESVRRAKSGAVASDAYTNKIVAEKSYMQSSNTRVVTFEMCGNDGLQARTAFKGQTGTCDYSVLDNALANCKTY